ncbi:hypothetical protein LG943_08590 [Streptomonospora sp. S1-112]|uniref:Histidine kinase/HSP90-like ATPase domain-containing protein n=1 Tax=Streptomonospora mangrovi TaxID=2883123 RepID=A0A9X3NJE9_9ACTN|nr:hypothetical protein [Streptomonospora mangrovi]MDA0564383.1 hypothetical protein [Streptomonospora mangrovi]
MVTVARHGVAALLAGFDHSDDAELITTELVASAVRASAGDITVHVIGTEDMTRIEVTDQRGSHPRLVDAVTEASREAPDGLGLVSAIAASMGSVRRRSGDCTTWAELRP